MYSWSPDFLVGSAVTLAEAAKETGSQPGREMRARKEAGGKEVKHRKSESVSFWENRRWDTTSRSQLQNSELERGTWRSQTHLFPPGEAVRPGRVGVGGGRMGSWDRRCPSLAAGPSHPRTLFHSLPYGPPSAPLLPPQAAPAGRASPWKPLKMAKGQKRWRRRAARWV